MGLFDNMTINYKINKLENRKSDLCDDQSSISNYNQKIDDIISDFQSFVKSNNSDVCSKLCDYKEVYQYNDSYLSSARTYIEQEISHLSQQLED